MKNNYIACADCQTAEGTAYIMFTACKKSFTYLIKNFLYKNTGCPILNDSAQYLEN